MRLPEQRLWDRFKRHRPKGIDLERVENMVAEGMPDVHVRGNRFETWVELKARESAPKRGSTPALGDKYGLSKVQENWHRQHNRFCLPSFVLARVGKDVFLLNASEAMEINEYTVGDMRFVALAENDWAEIYKAIEEHSTR